jgi:hypothetical protein
VFGIVASRRKGKDAERVKGVDASHVFGIVASRRKGIDAEHIHAGLHAGYRHRAHAVQKQSSCRV